MRLILNLLFAVALTGAAGASASVSEPVGGREYLELAEPQNTAAGAKIDVTEFFTYACPHCNSLEPALAAWVAANRDKVLFKRVHVALNPSDLPLQRLYATLEAMGIAEQTHAKVFEAVHVKRTRLTSDEAVFEWAAQSGMDRAKFIDTYRSFGTQARVNRFGAMTAAHKINHWPAIAVDGRFMTSPYQVGSAATPPLSEPEGRAGVLKVMDFLVARALSEKKK